MRRRFFPRKPTERDRTFRKRRVVFAASVFVVACVLFLARAAGMFRRPWMPRVYVSKAKDTVRVACYNIAHGRGLALYQGLVPTQRIVRNLKMLGDCLRRLDADVVGLEEIDFDCNWTGNVNQIEFLARAGGFRYWRAGLNNRNGGRYKLFYGNALLSRFPIVRSRNYAFGNAKHGEKGFLVADVRIGGKVWTFVVVHLDYKFGSRRRRQVEQLIEVLRGTENPLVVMGDFNCTLRAGSPIDVLCKALDLHTVGFPRGEGNTFSSLHPWRRLDYVLVCPTLAFANYFRTPARLSDHMPVVADLRLCNVNVCKQPTEESGFTNFAARH